MKKRVLMTPPSIDLGKQAEEGAHFEIRDEGRLFGRLSVTRKGIVWWDRDTALPLSLNWKKLDRLLAQARAQDGTVLEGKAVETEEVVDFEDEED